MSEIVEKAQQYVSTLLSEELDPRYLYHNLRHTQAVVKSTKELLSFHQLEKEEEEWLLLASWFHDLGYIQGRVDHERLSCAMATEFLREAHYDEVGIERVNALIMATRMGHVPQNQLEAIIKDADLSHFVQKTYWESTDNLREELSLFGIRDYSDREWRDKNIEIFQDRHQFHTDYAKEHWQEGKDYNLNQLLKEKKAEKAMRKKEALKAQYKSESPDRSIQTLYRITLRNHLTLSDIADTKANILLSVNAIIISVVLANLLTKLDSPSNAYLIYPTAILILCSVITMTMSVLATRPNVTSGKFTKEDVDQKKVNLLFFGNFHKMELSEYEWALGELVKDKDYVYSSLTKDLYYLGIVLNRKYKILRITYNLFLLGMIISVIAYGIAFRFYGPDSHFVL